MEHFPLAIHGRFGDALHVKMEAKKLAYAELIHQVGYFTWLGRLCFSRKARTAV
jgi:hypothetical protein